MTAMLSTFAHWLHQPWLFFTLLGLLGLIIGSFLNVVIYRLPRMMEREWLNQCSEFLVSLRNKGHNNPIACTTLNQYVEISILTTHDHPDQKPFNLMWPPSHCPCCQRAISWYDNIPLLSYLLLRGRCRQCSQIIPVRYFAIELITALLSLAVGARFGLSYALLAALLLTWILIVLTFIDIDEQILPDDITLFGLWSGLFLSVFSVFVPASEAILGAIAGYLTLWLLYWGFKLLTQKEGMGYGDFKLVACMGAWLGWKMLPIVILLSSVMGTIWGGAVLALQLHNKDEPMPFGPFIALAGFLTLMFGDKIVSTYLQWVY